MSNDNLRLLFIAGAENAVSRGLGLIWGGSAARRSRRDRARRTESQLPLSSSFRRGQGLRPGYPTGAALSAAEPAEDRERVAGADLPDHAAARLDVDLGALRSLIL